MNPQHWRPTPHTTGVGPPPKRPEYSPERPADAPDCKHDRVDVRRLTQVNSVVVAVRQCLKCGANCGALKKAEIRDFDKLPAFDKAIQEAWRDTVQQYWEHHRASVEDAHNQAWWAWYNRYLESPEWKAKRAAVIRRDKGMCQGCGQNGAIQVHHLTYDRVGREMLFDLVAVCMTCHEAIHAKAA